MVHLIQQVSSAAGAGMDDPTVFWSQLLALPHLNMLSGATATGLANGGGGAGARARDGEGGVALPRFGHGDRDVGRVWACAKC